MAQVNDIIASLTQHLQLDECPENLLLWNFNEPAVQRGYRKGKVFELIAAFEPRLAVIDSLSAFDPEAEEKNSSATRCLQRLREVTADCRCSILLIHHLRKGSDNSPSPRLEEANLREWFRQSRGASALINGSDVRLGVDESRDLSNDLALVVRGFERINGEISTIYLARDFDDDGIALGYRKVVGTSLLGSEQRDAYSQFPDKFRFTEAQTVYGRGPQATRDFLRKCISLGLLEQPMRRGPYTKTVAPGAGTE